MLTRRAVLGASLVGLAAPLTTTRATPPVVSPPRLNPYRVIWDSRYPASRRLGTLAIERRLRASAIAGDVAALTHHELDARWRAHPAPIIGLTTRDTLEFVELLGRDVGLSIILTIDHLRDQEATLHRLVAPVAVARRARALARAGSDWPTVAALLLLDCPASAARSACVTMAVCTASALAPDDPERLVSWVIAAAD
jgi:hypothetical protein